MPPIRTHSGHRFPPLILLLLVLACGGGGDNLGNEHLIRVGDRAVTVIDFNRAFELAETAHSFGLRDHPAQLREARQRLLNQMTVEMLMLARADELNLDVSEQELESKIAEIKSDYPEGAFEETFLEAAVPYDFWKERMKTMLLIDKLIATELQSRMTVTPADIKDHYRKLYGLESSAGDGSASERDREPDHEALIRDLKRRKAEQAYDGWIEELKARYPVEINAEVWEKLSDSSSGPAGGEEAPPADRQ